MIKKGVLIVMLGVLMPFLLSGCGENLFGNSSTSEDSFEQLMKNGDYTTIITRADDIINDPASTTADIQQALISKSEAQVGQMGISITGLLTDIATLETTDSSSTSNQDLFDLIDFGEGVTTGSLGAAIETMNRVSTSDLSASDLKSFELKKGLVNVMMSVEIVTAVYDTKNNAFVNESASSKENLNMLVNPGDDLDQLSDYAGTASTSLTASGAFDTGSGANDLAGIDDIVNITVDLGRLNEAAQNNQTITIGNVTYDFTGNDASDDSEIDRAMVDLLGTGEGDDNE